jgi:hypothetical protein
VSFFFNPLQRRQKTFVAKLTWECVVNDRPVGNPKRRFDEYSSKFSLSYETKIVNPVGKSQTTEGDAH